MVTVRSGGRRFAEGGVLTPLGLVVSEHVGKLAAHHAISANWEKSVMTLKKIVTTLSMCDLVESEMLSSGKVVYSIRNAA